MALMALLSLALGPTLGAEEGEFKTNARGLDRRNLDPSVPACVDFYQHANGGWLARNPIPEDQSRWGISQEMRERNYLLLREILDEAAASGAEPGTNRQKVGDFWATGMDTEAIEKAGASPLQKDLETIAAIDSLEKLQAYLRQLHAEGTALLFDLSVFPDLKQSDRYLVYATQGGLGLPERDYYTREDAESVALRRQYVAHVSATLQLLGQKPAEADAAAEAILALETRLARASLGAVELRDPANYYNVKTVAEAQAASARLAWPAYFAALDLGGLASFSYAQPAFFAEANAALGEVPLAVWRDYLRWHVTNAFSDYLSDAFVQQRFAFYGRTLQGARELRPRFKRVVDQASASLGEALGQVYVERAFPPKAKERALRMIEDLRGAVRARLEALAWMSPETKTKALEKLGTFVAKIGYPDEWRDYSKLTVTRDSYVANVRAASAFELRRNLDKLGKPIDRNEWGMPPQTVNAYYNPLLNEIVFPAAIMQPPFFDGDMDDAVNYGGMGAVIGHEIMHGFDDKGSRFDARGNMANWWSDADRARFEERTQKLVGQYSGFVAVDGLHVNGELTLGENIGDLAGLTMAYHALQAALARAPQQAIDGFTPEQRFFLAWAQAWRSNVRPEALKLQVNTDPHSPPKFRVNGPLANMPEFARAFACPADAPMSQPPAARADIW
jgi:putative endopeptidase